MFRKVVVGLCSMMLISLLAGCGSTMVDLEIDTPSRENKVEESKESTSKETETETTETEENREVETEITTETEASETETTEESIVEATAETVEEVESYVVYEEIEPITLYVKGNGVDGIFDVYRDPNLMDGALVNDGLFLGNC